MRKGLTRKERLLVKEAIEYLEAPHEAEWDLSNVPGAVLNAMGLFEPDYDYLNNMDTIRSRGTDVSKMTRKELDTMLTFFSRGERFSTGFTADVINSGELLAVLKRLYEL